MSGAPFEFVLPRSVDGPGIARRLLADWFAPALANSTLVPARLLVSELSAMLCVTAAGGSLLERSCATGACWWRSSTKAKGFERELRERDFERSGTRSWGLSIVDTESSRWGIGRGTTRVWFELDRWELRLETTGE